MALGDEFPWLQGLDDWYEDSSFKQWGEDLYTDVVNPALLGAYRTLSGDLTSGANEIRGAAQAASAVPDALWKGAQTAAVAPYAAAQGGLPGAVNAIDKIWGAEGMYQAPPEAQGIPNAMGTLFRPLAEAPGAAGEAVFEATGSPLAATVAETGTAAAEMLLPSRGVGNIVIPGTGKNLNLYGADPKLANPVRPPVNPKDPAGTQRGSVKVLDPDADTISEMFGKPKQVIPPVIRTGSEAGPQGGLFPQPNLMKSVIPEAIDRIAGKFGEKPIPAKKVAEELTKMGVHPDELSMFGLAPMLSYGVEEGHEIAPEDLRDAVAQKGNELQILTGGEGVNYGGEKPVNYIPMETHNLHKSSNYDKGYDTGFGEKQHPLFGENDDQAVAQAAEDFMTFNLIEPDEKDGGTKQFISYLSKMPASKPDSMSRQEFVDAVSDQFDRAAKGFMGEDYREKMRDPQYGQMERAWDERKQNFLDAVDRNLYWRDGVLKTAALRDDPEEEDPMIANARMLGDSGYQTDYKTPGTIENTISTFNFPKAAYGGRDSQQYHFAPPPGSTAMAHKRGGQRLAISDDFPYETLSDVPVGTDIPTMSFTEERQNDAHRAAQSKDYSQYRYSRDLFPQEQNKIAQLERERDLLGPKVNDFGATDDEKDKIRDRVRELNEEIDALYEPTRGATPDFAYKGRIAQTKLLIKDEVIKAVLRNDEFAGIATPRMVAMAQGSGQGMTFVGYASWNPDSETWDVVGLSGESVPTVEMKRLFSDEELAEAKASIQSKEDYKRDYLTFLVSEDPEYAKSVIENRDDTELVEETAYQIPLEYYTQPDTERKLQRMGFGRGNMLVGPDVDWAIEIIHEAHPEIHPDLIREDIKGTEREVIWDSNSDSMIELIGEPYTDLDDYVMQEAEKYVRDDTPDDRMNTMTPNQLDTYIDDDMYDEYLYENEAANLRINDEVILDESIAGSAANYNDNITIPAIQQIYDDLGLGKYEPTYVATPITDSPTDYLDDYEAVERVPVIPITTEIRDKVLAGEMTLFNPLNEVRTAAEKRADSVRRRQEAGRGIFADMGPDIHRILEKSPKELGGGLFAELPTDRLRGAPETVYVPGKGEKKYGNYQPVVDSAASYMDQTGMPYSPPRVFAPLDEARAKRIAAEYDRMADNPNDPLVKRAYQMMVDETVAQYEQMMADGLEVDFNYNYATPRDVIDDVIENNHMSVFSTAKGYGVDTVMNPEDNPLLAPTRFTTADGEPMVVNDLFRAVHDYYGHVKNGVGFRARGEEAAWQSHAAMFSPLARRAMTTETRGQNSWVNFGPNAEENRTASPEETRYADQKIGLLPTWVSEEGRLSAPERKIRFQRARQANGTGFEGAIGDDGRVSFVHYSRQPITRTDPTLWGTGLSTSRTERNRKAAGAPGRTYYGVEGANTNPYRKEPGLGSYAHESSLPGELIYDIKADPDNLWDSRDIVGSEQAIRDAGYSAYYRDHPTIGKVVAVFDELEVKPYE